MQPLANHPENRADTSLSPAPRARTARIDDRARRGPCGEVVPAIKNYSSCICNVSFSLQRKTGCFPRTDRPTSVVIAPQQAQHPFQTQAMHGRKGIERAASDLAHAFPMV